MRNKQRDPIELTILKHAILFSVYFLSAALLVFSFSPTVAWAAAPTAPTNLTATMASSRQINLSWKDNATTEINYYVERSPNGSSSWTVIATLGANVISYQNTGLTQNTTYYYRVRCKDATTYSNYSNTANAMTATLAAPTALSATVASASSINLAWTDNTAYETNYYVERSPNGTSSWTVVATVATNVTTTTNTGLTVGTAYYYRVRAYDSTNYSVYSSVVNQTIRTIAASAGSNGAIAPSGTVAVANGSTKAFTMTPNTGYKIATVTVDGSSVATNPTYTFSNITANHTIAATFSAITYTITASAGSNGTIAPSGTVAVANGSTKAFTMTPNTGYKIATVTVDGSSVATNPTYTFSNITANHTIAATFSAITYTITASAGANGSISPNGAYSVNSGGTATFTITPTANYHVSDVVVDGASKGIISSFTFTNVIANHTITASFAINTFTVTPSVTGGNGSINPSTQQIVSYGSDKAFTMTPNTGYYLSNLSVDGSSVATASTYTFTNISANHTIAATFSAITYTITASAGANGTISPSGAVSVVSGATQTFTMTPISGYHVSDVLVDGVSKGTITSYPFTNVTTDHTITASFAVSDTTPPNGSILINNGAAFTKTTTVTLTLSATDTGSGVSQMQFSNDNLTWSPLEAYATSKGWALTTGDGTKTVYANFKDNAGNWMTVPCSSSVTLDTTPPVVMITSPAAGNTNNRTPTLTYTVSDGTVVVKVDGVIVNKVSGNNLDILSFGTHTVGVESTDAANNIGYAEVTFTVTVVDQSLVGLWHMDGDWTDASGNSMNGTASGSGATFSSDARIGSNSGSFNGGYMDIGRFNYQTFTIEMWVKAGSSQVQYADIIDNNHSSIGWVIEQDSTYTNEYYWGIADGSALISFILPADQWTHIAITRDRNTRINTVYINGTPLPSTTGTQDVAYNANPFVRLAGWYVGGRNWNGLMDEVALYNRALSEQEIIFAAGPYVQIISPAGLTNNNAPLLIYSVVNGTTTAVKVDGNTVSKVSGDALDLLSDGTHTLRVEAVNGAGLTGYAETIFTVDTISTVSINPVTSPTNTASQTISGTMSDSSTVSVSVNTTATVGPVSYPTATTWRCDLTGLTIGPNIITVTAIDPATNTATATATITNSSLAIFNVGTSSNTINTALSESSTIFFMLNGPATATFKIIPEKQGPTGTPVYQSSKNCLAAGAYFFTWDGNDNNGKVVPDEAYLYIFVASDGTNTYTYSPPAPTGSGTVTCSQSTGFDPSKNLPMTITYSPAQPSRVYINITWGSQNFTIKDAVPATLGSYTFDWDGRSPSNKLLDIGARSYCSVASLLPENYIITSGDTVQITELQTDPYTMHLAYGQFTHINYTLSRQANVTVILTSPSGTNITLLSNQLQSAGPHVLDEWNGLDTSDTTGKKMLITEEGDYMVSIQAVNPATGSTSISHCNLRVGY